MRAIRRFTVQPVLPAALLPLGELATNLRWSWHPPTQDLFGELDAEVWEAVHHDPVRLLGAVTRERLEELAGNEDYVSRVRSAHDDLQRYLSGDRWFQQWAQSNPNAPASIAYFSPEFGITAVLPQYSGGLGILAGDHLKTASDLGVPIVGVGLLYRHGYFRQQLSREGWQEESYPVMDPDGLPLSLLRESDGNPVQISVSVPGDFPLRARVWVARVAMGIPIFVLGLWLTWLLIRDVVHHDEPEGTTPSPGAGEAPPAGGAATS